jgi:hypothetical protein
MTFIVLSLGDPAVPTGPVLPGAGSGHTFFTAITAWLSVKCQ